MPKGGEDCVNKFYPYSGQLFRHKEKWTNRNNNMAGSQNIYAEWKKPGIK